MMDPGSGAETRTKRHIAYVMSRFPKLTETFILYEMLAMEELGFDISIYPLLRQDEAVVHPEAGPLVAKATFLPLISLDVLSSQMYYVTHRPRAYFSTLGVLLRANAGSFNYLTRALAIFPKVAHAARLLVAHHVDHVHCHFSSHPAAAGFILRQLAGIDYSFTAHGSDLHVDRHMLREKVASASFVVAISEYNRQLIIDHCGAQWADKVVVIHSGVDTNVFCPPATGAEPRQDFTIACIGRFIEVKGQSYLIEACRRLVASGMEVLCYLVGDGPERKFLEQQVAAGGLGARVRFIGQLRREAVSELLQSVDVLVAPSVPTDDGRREGIPVVLMEAMATGVPVVASNISGIPELIEHGKSGILVPARDAEGLAGAIRYLAEHPRERRTMGKAARQKVIDEFDLRGTAQSLAARIMAVDHSG